MVEIFARENFGSFATGSWQKFDHSNLKILSFVKDCMETYWWNFNDVTDIPVECQWCKNNFKLGF